ncbi:hypothetical protein EJ05DRAFT_485561 [Pseudovirgaria hyperparasitica]|uniref:Uncharacterized protein n=1 Tax=Pseudovirgaria hyperparasitica TaxID=470096 RepID=A0A6A6WBE7_9PEZI|nr:uncharacterized protein EJ05DRAFT_485561 [Pseudovirgaria hyperparasitica]KAF2758431.1 hypothetical protein EJ05DRAFT_485561 [Pseudovirgaria hyperparasitica]
MVSCMIGPAHDDSINLLNQQSRNGKDSAFCNVYPQRFVEDYALCEHCAKDSLEPTPQPHPDGKVVFGPLTGMMADLPRGAKDSQYYPFPSFVRHEFRTNSSSTLPLSPVGTFHPSSENLISPDTPVTPRSPFKEVKEVKSQHVVPKQKTSTIRVWWYELFCGILVVLSFVALVITGFLFDGKTLPDWPLGLSINALVAVFSAIIKASVGLVIGESLGHLKWTVLATPQRLSTFDIYDDASRGPWGSARFLQHFGWKIKHLVPSIGAVITILLLIIDPFTQQIVQVRGCDKSTNRVATLPRTLVYQGDSASLDPRVKPVDVRIALYQGLFAESKPNAQYNCPTGNCTFPESSSVALCIFCSDVSDRIVPIINAKNDTNGETDWLQWTYTENTTFVLPGDWTNLTVTITNEARKYNRGEGSQNLERGPVESPTDFAMDLDAESIPAVAYEDRDPRWYNRTGPSLWNISMIRLFEPNFLPIDDDTTVHTSKDYYAKAHTCSILPCVRTYYAKVDGQRFSETVSEPQIMNINDIPVNSYDDFVLADLDCIQGDDRQARLTMLQRLGYPVSSTGRWLAYNVTFDSSDYIGVPSLGVPAGGWISRNFSSIPSGADDLFEPVIGDDRTGWTDPSSRYKLTESAISVVPRQCIYLMAPSVMLNILMELQNELSGTLRSVSSGSGLGPSSLTAVYNAGSGNGTLEDVQGLFNNVSDALSLVIRANGNASFNDPTFGIATERATCIAIQWPWITYFAALLGLFAIYTAGFLIQSRVAQGRLLQSWEKGSDREGNSISFHDFKASELPVLFHGLDHGVLQELDARGVQTNRVGVLEKVAGGIMVRLVPRKDGWKIARADNNHGDEMELRSGETWSSGSNTITDGRSGRLHYRTKSKSEADVNLALESLTVTTLSSKFTTRTCGLVYVSHNGSSNLLFHSNAQVVVQGVAGDLNVVPGVSPPELVELISKKFSEWVSKGVSKGAAKA